MRKFILALLVVTAVFACKDKKNSKGDEQAETNAFFAAYEKKELPFSVTDTNMNIAPDTTTISYSDFSQFVPDTILNTPFLKDRKLTIHPVVRFSGKNKEQYLVSLIKSKTKSAVYLTVSDNKNKFLAHLPLVSTPAEEGIVTTASIDKKFGITINKEWKGDDEIIYLRNIYAFNNVGPFTLMLSETNEQREAGETVVNPIDTFPKANKFSADYIKSKTNFISLRDGKDEQTYMFFVHFENDDDDNCSGEIRGELTMTSATTAIYRENGDPCVIDFTLTGNQVKVKEKGRCGNYRGIKCFFNDTYTKKKEPKPSKK